MQRQVARAGFVERLALHPVVAQLDERGEGAHRIVRRDVAGVGPAIRLAIRCAAHDADAAGGLVLVGGGRPRSVDAPAALHRAAIDGDALGSHRGAGPVGGLDVVGRIGERDPRRHALTLHQVQSGDAAPDIAAIARGQAVGARRGVLADEAPPHEGPRRGVRARAGEVGVRRRFQGPAQRQGRADGVAVDGPGDLVHGRADLDRRQAVERGQDLVLLAGHAHARRLAIAIQRHTKPGAVAGVGDAERTQLRVRQGRRHHVDVVGRIERIEPRSRRQARRRLDQPVVGPEHPPVGVDDVIVAAERRDVGVVCRAGDAA